MLVFVQGQNKKIHISRETRDYETARALCGSKSPFWEKAGKPLKDDPRMCSICRDINEHRITGLRHQKLVGIEIRKRRVSR